MGASSTSSTSSSVAATNPALNNLFTNLFTKGLGSSASGTLQNVLSGQQLQTNTSQLYSTLSQASQPQYQAGMAQVKEQGAMAGLTDSTSLTGQMGSYTNTYLSNLTNVATQMGLSETQMQGSVAGNLMSLLGTAGSQYYTNQSTTTTQMPWTSTFSSIMGAGLGIAGLGLSGGGTLGGKALAGLF